MRKYQNSYTVIIPEKQQKLFNTLKSVFSEDLSEYPSQAGEFGLTMSLVDNKKIKNIFSVLKTKAEFDFSMLIDLTVVDWLDKKEKRFEVVYQLLSVNHLHRLCIKAFVEEKDCKMDSVTSLWDSAKFLEREAWDMFGVEFVGHPDLRRILMYDEFVGHPLRKDYPLKGKQPRVELRLPELRNTSDDLYKDELVAMPKRK